LRPNSDGGEESGADGDKRQAVELVLHAEDWFDLPHGRKQKQPKRGKLKTKQTGARRNVSLTRLLPVFTASTGN
jgi:hypothetical protein